MRRKRHRVEAMTDAPKSDTINAVFRGIAGLILIVSVPVLHVLDVPFPEPLWALVGVPCGWFFRGVGK